MFIKIHGSHNIDISLPFDSDCFYLSVPWFLTSNKLITFYVFPEVKCDREGIPAFPEMGASTYQCH